MSDLISRQDAIDAIEEMQIPIMRSEFSEEQFVFTGMSEALQAIKDLPSAQPERKSGKCVWCDSPFRIEYYWIDKEGCTASFQDEERHIVATGIANFCPNCGADMRGEEDE